MDPLPWYLRLKQWKLRFQGYRRLQGRLGEAPFGYYHRPGKSGDTALVLVHGLALFPEWWAPWLQQLPRNYEILAPELLGFGRSPGQPLRPEAFTLSLFRNQLEQLIAQHRLKQVILVSVSLGGWVCLDYALAHPEGVKGLILIAPAGATPDVQEEDLLKLKEVFDYQNPEEFIHLINEYVLHRPRPIPRWVAAQAVNRSRQNGHKTLLNNLAQEDWIGSRVRDLQAPTALVWGRDDKVFPHSIGLALEHLIPEARLFTLEDAGHSYLHEKPGATCRALFEALRYLEN